MKRTNMTILKPIQTEKYKIESKNKIEPHQQTSTTEKASGKYNTSDIWRVLTPLTVKEDMNCAIIK